MYEAAKKPAWTWDFLSTPAYKYVSKNIMESEIGVSCQKVGTFGGKSKNLMDLWDPPFMYCVLFHPTKILFGTILKLGLQKAKCQLWQKRFFAALLIVKGWNCYVLISEWDIFYAAMWAALLYSMTLWVPCHVPCETRTHHDPQVRPDKRRCACWQPCQLHQRSDLPGIQVLPYLAILWFHSINFGGKRIPKTESFRFFLFFSWKDAEWLCSEWQGPRAIKVTTKTR